MFKNGGITHYPKKEFWKIILLLITEAFLVILLVVGLIFHLKFNSYLSIPFAAFFILLPYHFEKKYSVKINAFIFIFIILYILSGFLMGYTLNFFVKYPLWDKIMHLFCGILFAIIGYYHMSFQKGANIGLGTKSLFGLSFPLFIEVDWEIFEFCMDRLFDRDYQTDTLVTNIYTRFLSGEQGKVISIENINSVIVNNSPLPGYLDIGLTDTMYDLIVTLAGAMIVVLFLNIDNGRHPLFVSRDKSE